MKRRELEALVLGKLEEGLIVKVTLSNRYYTTTLNGIDPTIDDPEDIMKGLAYALETDSYNACRVEIMEDEGTLAERVDGTLENH